MKRENYLNVDCYWFNENFYTRGCPDRTLISCATPKNCYYFKVKELKENASDRDKKTLSDDQ